MFGCQLVFPDKKRRRRAFVLAGALSVFENQTELSGPTSDVRTPTG